MHAPNEMTSPGNENHPRNTDPRDKEKQAAARAATQLVEAGNVVGLGSGSTATYAIRFLAERVRGGLKIVGIPTSQKTKQLAEQLGIPLTTLEEHPQIDIDIDGADEIDPQLNLIKGGGGAFLREKIVASVSRRFIVIADSAKHVKRLGKFPTPGRSCAVCAIVDQASNRSFRRAGFSAELRVRQPLRHR